MIGRDVGAIINHFMVEQDARKFDSDYFAELVRAVPTRLDERMPRWRRASIARSNRSIRSNGRSCAWCLQ